MVHNSNKYTDFTNVSLKGGILRFGAVLSAALSNSDDKAIYTRGSNLYYWNGTSETNLGSGGSGGATSWDDLYADDETLSISSGTLTFAGAATLTTTDVVTFTAAAAVSGDVIQITNAGTGSDIKGTSATWSVSKAGAGYFSSRVRSSSRSSCFIW
jgi:autotransporter adhesin